MYVFMLHQLFMPIAPCLPCLHILNACTFCFLFQKTRTDLFRRLAKGEKDLPCDTDQLHNLHPEHTKMEIKCRAE
ncbi:hypothetical protein GQ55_6G045100 [Panicum hallii var. hallii]|uniref:Uncharacterized protein n=1 Tax=Panicum hallii var. hallii TaxID=1504633 RepID=A0A2T7D3U0_9POAL|nr:hypothetical protein GQ55_6G045100 [Panicum hallii var. hallii]